MKGSEELEGGKAAGGHGGGGVRSQSLPLPSRPCPHSPHLPAWHLTGSEKTTHGRSHPTSPGSLGCDGGGTKSSSVTGNGQPNYCLLVGLIYGPRCLRSCPLVQGWRKGGGAALCLLVARQPWGPEEGWVSGPGSLLCRWQPQC